MSATLRASDHDNDSAAHDDHPGGDDHDTARVDDDG